MQMRFPPTWLRLVPQVFTYIPHIFRLRGVTTLREEIQTIICCLFSTVISRQLKKSLIL